MKHSFRFISAALLCSLAAMPHLSAAQNVPAARTNAEASKTADDAHRKEDIAKHRQMARAHEEAAKCMEGGEKESVCQSRLQQACKGIAVGKYCGMRHAH